MAKYAHVYFDNSFGSELTGFSVDSVQCVRKARMIGAPVESGQISFDNKVIDPYDVVVKGTITMDSLDAASAINELQRMIDNRDFQFYSVDDGMNGYDNLSLVKFPNLREAEKYDWIQVELGFTHVMLVQEDSLVSESSNSENSNFRNIGYSGGK